MIDETTIAKRRRMLSDVFGAFEREEELTDGFRYVYADTPRARDDLQTLAALWRRGYPTLDVAVETGRPPAVRITGPTGTKDFLRDLTRVVTREPAITRAVRFGARLATAPLRVTPDFLVIGAAKCGTTVLHDYLVQHPSIVAAHTKEIYYLTNTFRRTPAKRSALWYRSHFPTRATIRRVARATGHAVTGEATPCYIFHPLAPRRAKALRPDLKLIALLRNPVDMAYSFYQMKLRGGIEALTFEEAIDREESRLAGEIERESTDGNYYSLARDHYAYLARGRYAEQLARWREHFPPEQMFVLNSEDFHRDPEAVVRESQTFLGLPPATVEREQNVNSGGPYEPLAGETRARLEEYFRPWNERLYEMLDRDFGW